MDVKWDAQSAPCVQRPPNQIESVQADLNATSGRIGELVSALADRLSPLLRPDPSEDGREKPQQYSAKLPADLQSIDLRFQSAADALSDLLHRLEI